MWISIITALITASSVLVGIWLKHYLKKRENTKKDIQLASSAMSRYIPLHNKIYKILHKAKVELGAKRIVIMRSENGGGIPKPGSRLYLTVDWEVHDGNLLALIGEWERVRIDEYHSDLLVALITKGQVQLVTDEMPKESILRGVYENDEIAFAQMYFLFSNAYQVNYMSISYSRTPEDPHESVHYSKTMQLIGKIAEILTEMDGLSK